MNVGSSLELLAIYKGENVRVYLSDGSVLEGALLTYDDGANVVLQHACSECLGVQRKYPTVFVRGHNIKYITKLNPIQE